MSPKILLAEDQPMNRKLFREILEVKGYTVVEARDGAEALALARADPPDLVLMDVQMPGMDGLEATRRIKADPITRHVPVLALTAMAMDGDEERVFRAGCDGYLPKPVRIHTLLERVEALVARPKPDGGE
ncbi:MAG: response regulator [Deltaproteobacteria bacterium]|nr:response regulator [Deltaproteobacteria bacterium]